MCTKRFYFSFIAAIVCQTLFAQQWTNIIGASNNVKEKPVYLSVFVEGGLSVSSYHTPEKIFDPGFSASVGYNLGAGMNMRFLKRDERSSVKDGYLGLQAGISYSTAGLKSGDVTINGHYICIPFDIQFYPIAGLFIGVGPEAYINVSNKPDKVIIGEINMNLTDHKANDIKLGVEAGYILKKFPVGISVKYLFGLSNFAENLPWKSNQLKIDLFYRFGF